MKMVNVGQIKGQDVTYNEETYEFSVTIGKNTFRAKSFPGLKKLVEKSEEVKWIKVMEISYNEATPPRILEVMLRGKNYYALVGGKLRVMDTYHLYRFNQKAFDKLTKISEEIRKFEERHSQVRNSLRRLI